MLNSFMKSQLVTVHENLQVKWRHLELESQNDSTVELCKIQEEKITALLDRLQMMEHVLVSQRHDISRLRAEKDASEDVIKLQELRDQLKVYKLDIEDLEAQLHDKTQEQALTEGLMTSYFERMQEMTAIMDILKKGAMETDQRIVEAVAPYKEHKTKLEAAGATVEIK